MGRKDGRRLKHTDPMYAAAMHIMVERNDAINATKIYVPLEPIRKYIREQKRQGHVLSHMGVVLAAYVRTVAEFPQMNRFIVNKRIYARNEISVGMVVLQPGVEEGETMSKMYFEKTDTVYDAQRKIDEYVEHNRQVNADNPTEKILGFLFSVPGLIRFGVNFIKWMDKHNLLPRAVIDMSPFHESLVITNLGSLRSNSIYHHIYNFGTTGMVIAMGCPEEVPVQKKGEIVFERMIPMGITMDERLCHGNYYVNAFHRFQQYMKDPSLLEGPPEVINEDCD